MSRSERLASAFYAQALSDWAVYKTITRLRLPRCHELHYLQMACEKLEKASKLRSMSSDSTQHGEPSDVDKAMRSHVGFERFVGVLIRSPSMWKEHRDHCRQHSNMSGKWRDMRGKWKDLAREIEKLAPAVDRPCTPENSEYPWERGDKVYAPCNYSFPALSLLSAPGGRAFLNFIERAFRDFGRIPKH